MPAEIATASASDGHAGMVDRQKIASAACVLLEMSMAEQANPVSMMDPTRRTQPTSGIYKHSDPACLTL
jgi:hypothetical protein